MDQAHGISFYDVNGGPLQQDCSSTIVAIVTHVGPTEFVHQIICVSTADDIAWQEYPGKSVIASKKSVHVVCADDYVTVIIRSPVVFSVRKPTGHLRTAALTVYLSLDRVSAIDYMRGINATTFTWMIG